MEQTLIIISFADLIIVLCFFASLVWQWKSKESIPSQVTAIVLATVLFALEIPQLILKVSLGIEYAIHIFTLVLWALNVFLHAFCIGKKMSKENPTVSVENPTVSVVIEISECISRDEDDAEGECENEQKD